ncbi:hypothetical protein EFA69_14700 [Rufibacter immobilis]|uniref:Uncharacterized protein n=1 Tax=Rufibacter immobilis TaxID=1348778 RepID=A0A3M9MPE0_9BACT|nr:hypothetical protein [Rufibacter immobilis]RNI27386.1 hypothetical protein EFA69_14700 [Rufibacter immobilis]
MMAFEFFLGGYGRSNFWVRLQDGYLHCAEGMGPYVEQEKTVSITDRPVWQNLVVFLENCRWKKKYVEMICDGTQWELNWQTPQQKLKSYGSNHYPADFDQFLILLNACLLEAGFTINQ